MMFMAFQKKPVEHRFVMPRQGEVLGLVERSAGASNFLVKCNDDKERTCSIPGKYRRRFWIKENDLVLVKPWVVQTDERGDIIWRYAISDRDTLKQRGFKLP